MHILNVMLKKIDEKTGILEPGQSGERQGRGTDINLTKVQCVTRETLTQGKRVYRVDVDFNNAFNDMSQQNSGKSCVHTAFPTSTCSSHYTSIRQPGWRQTTTVCDDYLRYRSGGGKCAVPAVLSDFMNTLLSLVTDRGKRLHISHGLRCGVQLQKRVVNRASEQEECVGQFNLIGLLDDL